MNDISTRFTPSSSGRERTSSVQDHTAPPPPDADISEQFLRKLERDPKRHDLESGGTRDETEARPSAQDTSSSLSGMTSPLESLFSGRMEQMTPAPAEAAAPASPMEHGDLEQLVERILVATPEGGGNEVRLTLGSQILPDTEIILQRDADGLLSVTLSSANASSFQTLVSSQGTLQQMLEQLENRSVRVEVHSDTGREDNDSRRRSRGYTAEDMYTP